MSSKIEYCDETWNLVTGCTKLSEGCRNCYAAKIAPRLKGRFGYDSVNPFDVTFHPDQLVKPFHCGGSKIIFVSSMGDLFHHQVNVAWVDLVLSVVKALPQHHFLLLTKRANAMFIYFKRHVGGGGKIPENLWVGVSVENQQTADERIPLLLSTPVKNRFISVEPLLERVVMMRTDLKRFHKISWVICGGETGRNARYMDPRWARSLRYECGFWGIPFFLKQMSHKQSIPNDINLKQFPSSLLT